ncbi:aromatic ring-hydroxylating dioxygenase subunit alpha [Mangrovicoccus algicola]|uniref:Rieske 2Fe-2S domain-containing protein n=1 Tax=Mangrovicoccus algicola TaxID=2771008 RepID=A0A8J7CJX0_9RHOB|nr:Rieske 2Fe-2S domain-containing protein [Mangrovicoccus algicola]MBE3637996.1 Rieske 2Fe-2S domain-containing protein [Mangrovicoccus algicola]
MLNTKQKTLRRFWYAVMPTAHLEDGPKPFTLLGEKIVLFLDGEGKPAALEDRCCHRTAKLSTGWCKNGNIVCGYHGWEYDRSGRLVMVPQFPERQAVPNARTRGFHAQDRYGHVWVALDDPIADIPDVPEEADPGFRRIHQFYDRWETSPFRLMENSFDAAHIAFVHRNTFGDINDPVPEQYVIEETAEGFTASVNQEVVNPAHAVRITGEPEGKTTRRMVNKWYIPFYRRLDIEYPSGLRHIIFNCATPIDDGSMQISQILFRNDTEADCPAADLIAWDQAIITEDKDMLECTDPEVVLDLKRRTELHMVTDRPGMIMRKRLLQLFHDHGEPEYVEGATEVLAAE